MDFVIIQLTGLDESKNDSKSSIFSKLILGATLEKYSCLVKSFIFSQTNGGDFDDQDFYYIPTLAQSQQDDISSVGNGTLGDSG